MNGWTIVGVAFFLTTGAGETSAESWRSVYDRGAGSLVLERTIELSDEGELLNPGTFCLDPKGNIWVMEPQTASLRKFTESGAYLTRIESPGQGPGDLSMPTKMAIAEDGTIAVYDVANRRFSFFGREGEFVGTTKFPEIVWEFDIGTEGEFYIETHEEDFMGEKGGATIRLWRYSADLQNGEVVDSILVKTNVYIRKPTFTNVPIPFHDVMSWAVASSGNIVVAKSDSYSIKVLSSDLVVLAETRHERKRVKVTDEDKEKHFDGMTTVNDGVVSRGAPDYIREKTIFPKYKPYFSAVTVDHEGYILVRTYDEEDDEVVFDVFEGNTNFVNQARLPKSVSRAVMSASYVYVLDVADEAVSIARYGIE